MMLPSAEAVLSTPLPSISIATDILVNAPTSFSESSATSPSQWLFLIWMGGTLFLLLRDVTSYVRLSLHLRAFSSPLVVDDLQFAQTARVRLFSQPDNDLPPMTFGFFSPKVFIPKHISDDAQKLPLVLDHELAHVRNHDFLLSFLERQFSHLLWFVPTVRLFADHINYLRELRCDMNVVLNRNPKHYAQLLLSVVEVNKNQTLVPAFASSYTHLKKRITMLTIERNTTYARLIKLMALFSGLFLMLIACDQMVSLGDGVELDASEMKMNSTDKAGTIYDKMPRPIGGLSALQSLISYPEIALKENVEARILVKFNVASDGSIQDVSTETFTIYGDTMLGPLYSSIEQAMKQAAEEAITKLEFKPAEIDGKPVTAEMRIPIVFKLPAKPEAASGE